MPVLHGHAHGMQEELWFHDGCLNDSIIVICNKIKNALICEEEFVFSGVSSFSYFVRFGNLLMLTKPFSME